MPTILIDYLFTILAIAGLAVVWRNLLENHPAIRAALQRFLPSVLFRGLTCGSCFTYWAAFFISIIFRPMHGWVPPAGFVPLALEMRTLSAFVFSWFALAMGSVMIRFAYVLLQERVHDIMHAPSRHTH